MNTTILKPSQPVNDALNGVGDRARDMARDVSASKDQLVSDFRALAVEAEKLLSVSAESGGEALDAARLKLNRQLAEARERLAELEAMAVRQAKRAATATDEYVHVHPWQSIAIAGGAGLLLGLVIGSQRREG
jgi:ElaB/YqjD/DUF883 family membrane-anchored ribosome-binding protein